ncbi:hypothetical protein TNCV_2055721 [Trichonephila clavipes]|nr:hypothetical protein TNCV_2055721 [Trichonephila clavipes]
MIVPSKHLRNWPKIRDSTGLNILSKFVRLGQRKQVCLQGIQSHVGVPGNEAADELAGVESFFTCPCSLLASSAHLLDCWGISFRQLYEEQDLMCDTITRKGCVDFSPPTPYGHYAGDGNNDYKGDGSSCCCKELISGIRALEDQSASMLEKIE